MEMDEFNNIAETLAREMKHPEDVLLSSDLNMQRVALPPGWTVQEKDDEKLLAAPRRKVACVTLADADSFIAYLKTHGSLDSATTWVKADYKAGMVAFIGIINDHGGKPEQAAWRDHLAKFQPAFSGEWTRWFGMDRKPFAQADFAAFIDDNNSDIRSAEGLPSGAQMLAMALDFEANQDMRFKSSLRLQSGGQKLTFIQSDDDQTIAQMTLFDRFAVAIPVFWNGAAFRMDARLRYRQKDGKLVFWFELIRPDKIIEAAAELLIQKIHDETGFALYFGQPF